MDVRACIETCSRELIRIKLDPPTSPTIFVDLVSWVPGTPEYTPTQDSFQHASRPPHRQAPATPTSSTSGNVPPPPPWSRSDLRSNQSPGPTAVLPPDSQRRKRKLSHLSDPDNVLVFETEPGQPPTGAPTTHRSVHQHAKSEISFIMHDPGSSSRSKPVSPELLQAPFQPGRAPESRGQSFTHPDVRPQRSHSNAEWNSPGRANGVTHSPHTQNRTPVQNGILSPQQRPLLSHSPQQRHVTAALNDPHSPRQLPPSARNNSLSTPPHTHSTTQQSPQQRHQANSFNNASVRSPTIQTTPHRHSVSNSPVLPPLHKAIGSPIASAIPAVSRIDSPSTRERLPPMPIASPHGEKRIRLVTRDEARPFSP